jgi:hypothetical protein
MICFAKPGLTEDLCVVCKEEFVIIFYMCHTYTWRKPKHIHKRQTHLLVREDVTWGLWAQEFSCKISGREPQGAWRQEELIGGKPPVVSKSDSDTDYESVETEPWDGS